MQEATPKNEYELKREGKDRQDKVAEKKLFFKKVIKYGSIALILGLIIWAVVALIQTKTPQAPDLSKAYEIQSREHIAEGAKHGAYNSNPPSGGPHYSQPARRMFYTDPLPDERVIHNLEHGDGWIAYHPRISQSIKDELKKFLFARIIITPRAANDFDISLVVWGRVDGFNIGNSKLDEARINDFIKRYRNKGPEDIPLGMDQTFN